ncbi:unnamed protein product [Effrenium voratum]|nr:unnamed protein product [Effrenium voratum]
MEQEARRIAAFEEAKRAEEQNLGTKAQEVMKAMKLDFMTLDHSRQVLHRWISWSGFDSAVGIVIIANAVTIGLETHYALQIPSGCNPECRCAESSATCQGMPLWLVYIDYVFFGIYVIEFLLRFYTYGRPVFKSNWIKFDLFLVCSSAVDLVMQVVQLNSELLDQRKRVLRSRLACPMAPAKHRYLLMRSSSDNLYATWPCPDQGDKTVDKSGRHDVEKTVVEVPFWETERAAWMKVFVSPMNILLIFVPLGLIAPAMEWNSAIVFGCNFVAIVPLASILGAATEAMAAHTGQMVGGLLNATFGNAVEMIMCVQAVRAGLIQVVQGNLLGSVLSNLLLVLGMAILGAGYYHSESKFNSQGAAANMTCQVVASISICLPTMFRSIQGSTDAEILLLSRICSLFLCLVYFMFLVFQLYTHSELFSDEGGEEEHHGAMSLTGSTVLLAGSTLVVAACSEGLVDSIEDVSENFGLPKAFIGVILLPIVGNAAEHATAVTSAMKGMMDLSLGVAVGSSTQIALFVVPCAVLWGWIFDSPMTLSFRNFDTACQMVTVFLVSQVLSHGNTNWLHGVMLMTTYILIAAITWFIPE